MKLAERYNRANLLASLVMLIITGIIYYTVIHFILTDKLDRDLEVEENEIRHYVSAYQRLPLASSYLDQQVHYKEIKGGDNIASEFSYTTYFNAKENEEEPGRSLMTTVNLGEKTFEVVITKSRVEFEDLARIILLITLGVTVMLLVVLMLINSLVLNRLWKPFYTLLGQMKSFDVSRIDNIGQDPTGIAEFRELNTSVNAMAARVRKDYKELKSFTDNASHEMMTPLAVINSKLDSLLQTGAFTIEQGALLEDIYNAIGRLFRLNQSLLLLAKIENNLIPDLQEIDMKEMLEGKISQFQELFEKDGLSISLAIAPSTVRMSRYLADILLNNLIGNAVRHNNANGSIEFRLDSESMQVINTGKDFELNNQLFERFAKSVSSEGTGLGLAISKQICVLYGFSINYENHQGRHCFSVTFSKQAQPTELLHN